MSVQKVIKYNPVNLTGDKLDSTCELNLNILENSGNYLVYKDCLRHFSSQRQRTVSTKTRREVRGGGRKPWRQKGTGQARVGSNRSPLWKGGGVIFGPKPNKINLKLNKKERQLSLQTLLFSKRDNIIMIQNLENEVNEPKTKTFLKICRACSINITKKILVIVSKKTIPLKLSIHNLQNIEVITASNLNTVSLLKAQHIILTPRAVYDIKEIYHD